MDTLRFQLTTRVEFERLVQIDPDTLTDLERAARFLYLQRTAFGGKVSGRNFGVDRARGGRFNLTTLEPMLEDLHSRLSGVVIECLDWSAFIPRYDSADTLFYISMSAARVIVRRTPASRRSIRSPSGVTWNPGDNPRINPLACAARKSRAQVVPPSISASITSASSPSRSDRLPAEVDASGRW